ncbi:WD domain [Entamoeba marina]
MFSTQPSHLASALFNAPPLKSIVHKNVIYTIIDNKTLQKTELNNTGSFTSVSIHPLHPLLSFITSSTNGLLVHQRSQPIQLMQSFPSKPIQTYDPLPETSVIITTNLNGFYCFHSSTLFHYSFNSSNPLLKKRIKPGAVSCLCHYESSNVLLCGTYEGVIQLYSGNTFDFLQSIVIGQGITSMKLYNDHFLIIATRKDTHLTVIDLRKTETPVALLNRNAQTNQRLGFDVYKNLLVTGSLDGFIHIYNLSSFTYVASYQLSYAPINDVILLQTPTILITTSGERYFRTPILSEDDSDDGLTLSETPIKYNNIISWNI